MITLKKQYNVIDFAKYAFESNKEDGSYVTSYYNYERPEGQRKSYIFNCEECKQGTEIENLMINNNIITCECGHQVDINELQPRVMTDNYYSQTDFLVDQHNLLNGTFNKYNVPTIINNNKFFCNQCHKIENIYSYEKEDGKLICNCGAEFTFDECKLIPRTGITEDITGDIYFDNNKISISIIQSIADINRHGNYFWQSGNVRVTMNLETGYTYMTNTGCCYAEFNRIWKRRNGHESNAPKMFNATYAEGVWNQIRLVAITKTRQLRMKYANYPNLLKLIHDKEFELRNLISDKLIIQIDNYMTNYFNNKFNYRIKSVKEIVMERMPGKESSWKEYQRVRQDILSMFVLHNRFVNADYIDLAVNLPRTLNNLKYMNKKTYKKLHRETNKPLMDVVNIFISPSKSLKKLILNDFANGETELHWDDAFFSFLVVASYFKKKENVNKLYKLIRFSSVSGYYNLDDAMEFWLQYRTEKYLSNIESSTDFRNKLWNMKDTMRTIYNIKAVYGQDWDPNANVKFHNEKQFHDDLMAITRTPAFKEMQDAKRKAELSVPFEMEEEVFKLESKDITIALNEYELTTIGNQMHICVGGYGFDVKHRNCRIAYIKEGDEYKACLELRVIKKDNKVKYELHQAKLKYNEYVSTNERYFEIVTDWCKDNNIKIVTGDMNKRLNN